VFAASAAFISAWADTPAKPADQVNGGITSVAIPVGDWRFLT
jgi:hypothetical protein